MSSLFPWMGGKSRLVKRLCGLLPEHQCYVEVFAGAANLLFAKPQSRAEVINDINGDLVNLFRVVQWHPREFLNHLAWSLHSREIFIAYNQQSGLTDIQRAARTWYLLKTRFGGSLSGGFGYGTTGKAKFRRSALRIVRQCHKRLDGVTVEQLDFSDCLRRYDRPHTLFYCDPPYLGTAGYQVTFDLEQHRQLADRLAVIQGKFVLSVNDHAEIRRLYKGYPRKKIPVRYSVSRDKSAAATQRVELVITNFDLPRRA